MSILRLAVAFLLSLFKSQRQLILENLALRQQVTMLRQSVKRHYATSLWWQSPDSLAPAEATKKTDALDEPDARHLPQALPRHHRRRVVRFAGCIWSFLPPLLPILLSTSRNISARRIFGVSVRVAPLPLRWVCEVWVLVACTAVIATYWYTPPA
jgi:hypothetical protein